MTITAVDMHTTIEQLSVFANGDINYRELYQITATGDDPLVDPTLTAFDRYFTVKGGDPDTGKPTVEEFRSDVA